MGVKHVVVAVALTAALARPAVAEVAEVHLGTATAAPTEMGTGKLERVAIRLDHPLQMQAFHPPHAWIEVRPAAPALAGVVRSSGSHPRAPKHSRDVSRFEAASGFAYETYFPAAGLESVPSVSPLAGAAPVTSRWTFVSALPANAGSSVTASRFESPEHLSGTLFAVRASF